MEEYLLQEYAQSCLGKYFPPNQFCFWKSNEITIEKEKLKLLMAFQIIGQNRGSLPFYSFIVFNKNSWSYGKCSLFNGKLRYHSQGIPGQHCNYFCKYFDISRLASVFKYCVVWINICRQELYITTPRERCEVDTWKKELRDNGDIMWPTKDKPKIRRQRWSYNVKAMGTSLRTHGCLDDEDP